MEPKILISGNYNVFDEGWDGQGSYMCSGLYQSNTFKLPIYIGGSETIQNRIEGEHIPKLNRNKHNNSPFQYSWNNHTGASNFVWWLLESCPSGQAAITEQKYLDLYRPFVDEFGGFNISHNATSPMLGRKHTKETKEKMSENSPKPMLGKKHTKEVKNKISKNKIGKCCGKNNPMFGKKRSLDERLKMSINNANKTKIKQINPVTNEIIKIWDTIANAEKELNNGTRSAIGHVCSKTSKKQNYNTALGFKWEFV